MNAAIISMLSDEVLLEIFDFFQRNHDGRHSGSRFAGLPEPVWDWHILAHVCQRWRQVIFASPLRLNLRILCKHRTPVQKNLDIWPTFPIHVEYVYPMTLEGIDEDNVMAALKNPSRVGAVGLSLMGPQLGKMIAVMQESFPNLTHLYLDITPLYASDVPVLPPEFLGRSAPCLQAIEFYGIPFPELTALLLSASDLVTLYLFNIPQTGYISPEAMVAALATLTRLEDLDIQFQYPASRPDRIYLPPTTRAVLPALTSFEFRGVHEYLDDFVARVCAPRLHKIWITYFNQSFDFEVPHLCQFIENSEDLNRPMHCLVEFQYNLVTFSAGPTTQIPESGSFDDFPRHMYVDVLCEGVDWQVSHLAQVLNQIYAVLSNTIHFAIISHPIFDPISPEPDMDDIEWPELLRPFSSVQTLFVSKEFSGHVSRSLEDLDIAGVNATVLPALDMLCLEYQPMPSIQNFIASRSESGHPVTLVDTRKSFEERLLSYIN